MIKSKMGYLSVITNSTNDAEKSYFEFSFISYKSTYFLIFSDVLELLLISLDFV